jgi:hypothetical protein
VADAALIKEKDPPTSWFVKKSVILHFLLLLKEKKFLFLPPSFPFFFLNLILRFGYTLNEHFAQLNDVEALSDASDVSMFSVVVIQLKDSVRQTCENCINMLHRLLPEMAAEKRTELNTNVRANYQVRDGVRLF